MTQHILQLVVAAPGWRTAHTYVGTEIEDLDAAEDEDLMYALPVACFALTRNEDGEEFVKPVCAEDWPSYLWVKDDSYEAGNLGILAPGETLGEDYRAEAVAAIRKHRESKVGEAL